MVIAPHPWGMNAHAWTITGGWDPSTNPVNIAQIIRHNGRIAIKRNPEGPWRRSDRYPYRALP